jgi:hypothetical protein
MRVNKSDTISRVKCVVNSCQYYESGDQCRAQEIEIQPRICCKIKIPKVAS